MKKIYFLLVSMAFSLLAIATPIKKIIVAQDGTGNYTKVQEALDAVPFNNQSPIEIFIKKGIYKEKLHLDSSKCFVKMIGEDAVSTILSYDDHTGKVLADGSVINTMNSQSIYIKADDFTAENITFQNDAGLTAGQAVALKVAGDRASFINCRIIGFQDTLFTSDDNSRQYYFNCYIEGSTDFIFGSSTALFVNCHLHSKKNSHITAASTPREHAYGYVFLNCRLTADTGITKVSLGRPWRPYASVTYIHCEIGSHILAQGWDNWKNPENEKTARYAEYKNTGAGAGISGRVGWSQQLTDGQAKQFTTIHILRNWVPDYEMRHK